MDQIRVDVGLTSNVCGFEIAGSPCSVGTRISSKMLLVRASMSMKSACAGSVMIVCSSTVFLLHL